MYFIKQKHETIFYRTSKTIDNLKFKKELNGELMKHDANDIDYEIFYETVLSILNAHAHLKKKQLSANHATFLANKNAKYSYEQNEAKEHLLKKRTEATKAAYNYQRNICISILRTSKRCYFENPNVKLVIDNKNFWKNVASFF